MTQNPTERKKRILISGEASFLSTGFSNFNRELLKRLHATGKYELAEVGSYAPPACPESKQLAWPFYGILPTNEEEKKLYDSHPQNQFGKYKIDAILADFQPDIVFDPRDPWMVEHLQASRFRGNYKLFLMPTVDSAPQKKQWVEGIFKKADALTTYSRYGKRVLESSGVKVMDVTSPGVDLEIWKPIPRKEIREKFIIKPTLLIFGTVMRNQKRKLYPDLFQAYAQLRRKWVTPQKIARIKKKVQAGGKLDEKELHALRIQHSALFCHTSWPDMGWNIPGLVQHFNLQRHTLFTYKCDACDYVYVHWFSPSTPQGATACRKCGKMAAHMPGTHSGVSEKDLIELFNLIDIYVHPAICEGWGLPIMESKACGIAGMYQNYSAMEDHVENGGGLPIKVQRLYHEAETEAIRSFPDIDDITSKMEMLAFDEHKRKKLAKAARACAVRMHSWDLTGQKIETILDNLEVEDRGRTWDKPPKFETVTAERPSGDISDELFVRWCYTNILGREPEEKGMNDWMAGLQKGTPRDNVEAFFRDQVNGRNKFEEVRWTKSLALRGIEVDTSAGVSSSNVMPGMIV